MAADERFSRNRRITHRNDFLRIQSTGRKCRASHFLLASLPGARRAAAQGIESTSLACADESRLGVTITTKVDKRATRRNRLKRRIREIFRKERKKFAQSRDVVVIALTGSVELDFDEVEREVLFLFRQSGMYRRNAERGRSRQKEPIPRGT
jgi:ribonuclease P protein component